jgi:rRNA-processing protein FCF1
MISLRPGVSYDRFRDGFQRALPPNLSGGVNAALRQYARWCHESEATLGNFVSSLAVEQLLHTPRQRWLLQIAATTHFNDGTELRTEALTQQLNLERDARNRELDELYKEAVSSHHRWSTADAIVVVDTSFLMHFEREINHAELNIGELADTALSTGVIIPQTVIEELEGLKDRGEQKQKTRARSALRALDTWFTPHTNSTGAVLRFQDNARETWFELVDDDALRTTTFDNATVRDQTIVDVAVLVQTLSTKPVRLLSHDSAQRMRARRAGVLAPNIDERRTER